MKIFLDDFKKDQLLEVVNMGAGNASASLSQMINRRVEVKVPKIIIDEIENISSYFGDLDKLNTIILLKMTGETPGVMLLSLSPEDALEVVNILTKKKEKDIANLDEMGKSALCEVGNIVTGNSITALAKFLEVEIIQSTPEVVTDMMGSIINSIVAEVGEKTESVLVFEVSFLIEAEKITSKLFFMFDPNSTSKILEITNKKITS